MEIVATIAGIALIILVLWEGFETIILPWRVTHRFEQQSMNRKLTAKSRSWYF